MIPLFWAAASLYGAATVLFLGFIVGMPDHLLPWARRALATGFVVQLAELGARGVAHLHPVSSVREVIGFLAWIAVGLYLVFDRKRAMAAVGAIVAPAALILLLAARLTPA